MNPDVFVITSKFDYIRPISRNKCKIKFSDPNP